MNEPPDTPIPRIAITAGEPAGIGPDIVIALAAESWPAQLIVLSDPDLLRQRAAKLGVGVDVQPYDPAAPAAAQAGGQLLVEAHPFPAACRPGRLDPANAANVVATLERACDGCLGGEFAAMVTAPVQKSVINDGGIPFSGHTEFLADRCGADLPVMLLVAGDLRVALVTTHLPLRDVPDAITADRIRATMQILDAGLTDWFGIAQPRITVLGLNPHAGESGHLGTEDQRIIEPVVAELRDAGMDVTGPLPADTAFTPQHLQQCDAVLAMYHDQGLPVLKHQGFGHAVNLTLGLPIFRTSVDHGTALDLAGTGRADIGSLRSAVELAIQTAR